MSMVESFLIKSYGNVLKTFARKISYSENSQDKKMCREKRVTERHKRLNL